MRLRLIHQLCLALPLCLGLITVAPASATGAATTTTLAVTVGGSAVTTVASGTVVTLTATVLAGSTPVSPGQVDFCDANAAHCTDIHLLGQVQLSATGTATFKFRPGPVGSHSYKAVFLPTAKDATSSSAASALTVTAEPVTTYPTATNVVATGSIGNYTLTGTVYGGSTPPPAGTLSFTNPSNQVIATAPLTAAGTSQIGLFEASNVNVPNSASITGDLNGDGIADFIELAQNQTIVVYLGNGDGTFKQLPAFGGSFTAVVSADFNGDGIPDLAVTFDNVEGKFADETNGTLVIYIGKGDGTFTALPNTLTTGIAPFGLAAADFNGDGITDLEVVNLGGTVNSLIGAGDGTFTSVPDAEWTGGDDSESHFSTSPPVVAGDVNGDGIPDLVIINNVNNYVSILLGVGDGTFSAPSYLMVNTDPSLILLADVNGDGAPDLIFGGNNPIYLGTGSGNFAADSAVDVSNITNVADMNGDGNLDLIQRGGASLAIYLGDGQGDFTATTLVNPQNAVPNGPSALADFNGDGLPDYPGIITELGSSWSTATVTGVSATPAGSGGEYITADFAAEGDYTASAGYVFLSAAMGTPTVSLSSSASTAVYGTTVTFTATVSGGGLTPTGQVNFDDGTTYLGVGTLTNGVATFSSNSLATGSHSIVARYLGDTDYYTAASSPLAFTVTGAPQVPTVTVSPSYTDFSTDQAITVKVTVAGTSGSPTPTGSVTLSGGGYSGQATLTSGAYVFSIPYGTLSAGTYSLTASYTGNVPYANGSGSAQITVTVAKPATMISPAAGAVLSGSSATFTWTTATNAQDYFLWIGTNGQDSNNLYNSAAKTGTSYTFTGLPASGTLYVRLITNYYGNWVSNYYTYAIAPAAAITSPSAGSKFTGSSVTFDWSNASSATGYYLWIGSIGVGSNNLYNSAEKTVTSYTFTQMPTNGETIYVRLNTNYNGTWVYNDYVYYAATNQPATMTSPAQGTSLGGSSVTFNWTAATGASGYYLWIGSTGAGSNNIYNSAEKTVTSYTFTQMPTNGETIYVRLNTNYNGTWVHNDYTYTAYRAPAALTSPAAGSTLSGSSVTFTWTAPTGATGYYLWIGSTGVGSNNIYNSAEKTVTSYTFTQMPTNGETIYVRLNTNYNGTWVHNDYTFKAAP